jgi:micrococcal nuclease
MTHLKKFLKLFSQLVIIPVLLCLVMTSCGIFSYNFNYDSVDDTLNLNKNASGITENDIAQSSDTDYFVKEVIDGDTLILNNNERVRLLGINTPEHNQYYFEEAREVLEVLVLGKKIKLEKDITDKDVYGRLLRYIFTDNLFVNEEMVKRGFANTFTFSPDVKYTDKFLEAEKLVRDRDIGLWAKSNYSGIEININSDAAGDDKNNLNGEYVIFKNINSSDLNPEGWTVKDMSTNIYLFKNIILKAGSKVFLFSGTGNDGDWKLYWNSSKPVWNNDHDILYLRDGKGLLAEIFSY